MSKRIDYTGKKFGHLLFLRWVPRSSGEPVPAAGKISSSTGAHWLTLCDCGAQKVVIAKHVAAGKIRSCGKCQYHKKILSERGDGRDRTPRAIRALFQRYLRECVSSGGNWSLSHSQFSEMIKQPCSLCGASPRCRLRRHKLVYTPIDRLDRSGGYTGENAISCCKECIQMRGRLDMGRFLERLVQIYMYLQPGSSPHENKLLTRDGVGAILE